MCFDPTFVCLFSLLLQPVWPRPGVFKEVPTSTYLPTISPSEPSPSYSPAIIDMIAIVSSIEVPSLKSDVNLLLSQERVPPVMIWCCKLDADGRDRARTKLTGYYRAYALNVPPQFYSEGWEWNVVRVVHSEVKRSFDRSCGLANTFFVLKTAWEVQPIVDEEYRRSQDYKDVPLPLLKLSGILTMVGYLSSFRYTIWTDSYLVAGRLSHAGFLCLPLLWLQCRVDIHS